MRTTSEIGDNIPATTAMLNYTFGVHVDASRNVYVADSEDAAREVEKTILQAADGKLTTVKVDKKQRRRNPAAPG